jgi:hypothetical protein
MCGERSELSEERVPHRGDNSLNSLDSQPHPQEPQEINRLLAAAVRAVLSLDALADKAELMVRGELLP